MYVGGARGSVGALLEKIVYYIRTGLRAGAKQRRTTSLKKHNLVLPQ
jgi:hypothetical protein